jgi:hypothetical protein
MAESKEKIIKKLHECLYNGDVDGWSRTFKKLMESEKNEEEVVDIICWLLHENYTFYKEESFAVFLEKILEVNPGLGMLKFPENKFYHLSIMNGSTELFDCYSDLIIKPYIARNDTPELEGKILVMAGAAKDMLADKLGKLGPLKLGREFNSGIAVDNDETKMVIDKYDYDQLIKKVNEMNVIWGLRKIIISLALSIGWDENDLF